MSVDLQIWNNHKLVWGKSPNKVISGIETLIDQEIQTFHSKEKEIIGVVNDLKDVQYYTFTNQLEHNFNNEQEITIRLNYNLCSEIRIFKSSCLVGASGFFTRWSSWKKLLSKEYMKEENKEKQQIWNEYFLNWLEFDSFLKQFVASIGGDEILYINDLAYQVPEDLFYKGEDFGKVKSEFLKIGKCEKLYQLYDGVIDHELGQIWFNQKLR